jgi:hypothetical protein
MGILGSTIYLGGPFTTVNNGATARNKLAAVDAISGLATAFDANLFGTGGPYVMCMTVTGGVLRIGGNIMSAQGKPVSYYQAFPIP